MNKKYIIIAFSWMLVAGWMVLIHYLSGQSGEDSGKLSEIFVSIAIKLINIFSDKPVTDFALLHHYVRKAAHFCVYLVFGFLMTNAFNRSGFNRRILWVAAILCIAYATFDEIHQMFVPDRGPSAMDVIIDGSGALIGCIIYGISNHLLRAITIQEPLVQPSVLKPAPTLIAVPEFKIAEKQKLVTQEHIKTPVSIAKPKPQKVQHFKSETNGKKYFAWLWVICWMTVIFWFSSETLRALKYAIEIIATILQKMAGVALDKEVGATLITLFVSEMFYIGLFSVLGFFIYNALTKSKIRQNPIIIVFTTIAICAIFSISDEIYQIFINGADSSPKDTVMDIFGTILGCLIFSIFKRDNKSSSDEKNINE